MFTLQQHIKTGNNLQALHDQFQSVSSIISGAYPQKHPLYRAAVVFDGGPYSPFFDLRDTLDSLVCNEMPNQPGTAKNYFRNSQPDYCPPDSLPGLPEKTARKFNDLQKQREMQPGSARQSRLTAFELTCLVRSLHHSGHRMAALGIDLATAYHPDSGPADRVQAVLTAVERLTENLLDELTTNQQHFTHPGNQGTATGKR